MKMRYTINPNPLVAPKTGQPEVWHLNTSTCLDDETIAAFIDGTLHNPEHIRVSEHLNYCPRCYELVSETRAVLQMAERDKQVAQDEVRDECEKELDTAIRKRLDELEAELPHLVECEQWQWLRTRT